MLSALIPLNTEPPSQIAMDIIFVHGLNGHWKDTWQKNDYSFWPKWLVDRFPMCRVWSFDYPAASTNWVGTGMAIVDRANNFSSCLDISIGNFPIVFITHSLGGLVTKALLRSIKDQEHPQYPDRLLGNLSGLVFFATPHHGSFWGTAATIFPGIRPSATTQDLQAGDRNLADLNAWFRTFATDRQLPIKVFSETQPTANVGLVVDQTSADPGIARVVPVPLDADHVSICKFDNETDAPYLAVCKFIQDRLSDRAPRFANQSRDGLSVHLGIDISAIGFGEGAALKRPHELTQRYKIHRKADSIRIYSDIPYIDRFNRGGPVRGYQWTWTPFANSFPALDFKIANNTSEVVFVSEAEFNFESSRPRKFPVLIFRDDVPRGISIANAGSGVAREVRLRFVFQTVDEEPSFLEDYPHDVAVGDIDDDAHIDLTAELRSIESQYPATIVAAIASSANEAKSILAVGQITWKDETSGESHCCDFATRVFVGQTGYGLPAPPSSVYDLQMRSDSDAYSETVPVSHNIKPGETDRFQIVLFCDSASLHQFRLTLRSTSDVVFESPLITMDYFVQRSEMSLGYQRP